MNEFEENIYKKIKNELIQSVIDKKIETYFINRNELTHYYNVGKMIVDAQGGEVRAKYGDNLIKKISQKLTKELGKGYSTRSLKLIRKFYLFQKGQPVVAQSFNISWSHIVELLPLNDINEIKYYLNIINIYHLGVRELRKRIKSKEYQRLDNKTKNKLMNKAKII